MEDLEGDLKSKSRVSPRKALGTVRFPPHSFRGNANNTLLLKSTKRSGVKLSNKAIPPPY